MPDHTIDSISTRDARFRLPPGAGTDSIHTNPEYCLAVTMLGSGDLCGTGIALTLGEGNRLVCETIELLAKPLAGLPIEELMADFGRRSRMLADDPCLRWLGPHKGIVHLALASITNACFDLWAKSRGIPLWKLLLDLTPQQVVDLLDLSYLEDVLTKDDALALLQAKLPCRSSRESILTTGYPGYDTSVGWIAYNDDKVAELAARAVDLGFRAFKLKVGSPDSTRDLRRAAMLRERVGSSGNLMFDAKIAWCSRTSCNTVGSISCRPIVRDWPASASFLRSVCWRENLGCPCRRMSATWDKSISIWCCSTILLWDTKSCSWNTYHTCAIILSFLPR